VIVDQPQKIFTQGHSLLCRRQPERADLRQFDSLVQPRPVGPEEYLLSSSPPNGPIEQIESPHPGGAGINVRVAYQVIDQSLLRPPVIGETSQVRDDEWHVGILLGDIEASQSRAKLG
jgi:hypothetical protein